MKQQVFLKQSFLFLIYIYILVSFFNEIIFVKSIINIITIIKYIIIMMLALNVSIDLMFKNKINKEYVYMLFFILAIQSINIVYNLLSYNMLQSIFTSMSYIFLFWIFFLHINEINFNNKVKIIQKIYLIICLLLFFIVIYTVFSDNGLISEIGGRRRYLFGFQNANRLASLIFVMLNIAIFSLKYTTKRKKILYGLSMIFLLGVLILTNSRTPLFILCIQIILIGIRKLWLLRRINYYYLIIVGIIILIYIIKLNILHERTFYLIDGFLSGRFSNWANIIMNMNDYEFIFGIASENTYSIIEAFYPDYKSEIYIDNFYIYYFFHNGLLGIILLLIYLGYIFKFIKKHIEKRIESILIPFFISAMLYSFFEGWLISINNITSVLFWLFLSSLSSLNNTLKSDI